MKLTLKAARVNKGLTQQEAADLLDISRSTLQAWETYKSYPTVEKLPVISATYGVDYDNIIFLPPDYALSGTEDKT